MTGYPKRAMILAAGLGTRLRPMTEATPKPAIPLCGIPPLRWNLALLAGAGVETVVINTHWRAEAIHEAVGDPADMGIEVIFSHEPEILGTGGGLAKAASYFRGETFYLVNGKVLFDADLPAAVDFHRERRSMATMLLRPYPERSGYSAIEIDSEGLILRFVTKGGAPFLTRFGPGEDPIDRPFDDRSGPSPATRGLFTGIHILEPEVLGYLPEGRASCINTDGYGEMLKTGRNAFGLVHEEGYFAEPSTPLRYLGAALDVASGFVDLQRFKAGGVDPFDRCHEPAPGVHVHCDADVAASAKLTAPCWIGPRSIVGEGAALGPGVVVEADCVIGPGAKLEKTLIWPETRVEGGEEFSGMVVCGGERVRVEGAS